MGNTSPTTTSTRSASNSRRRPARAGVRSSRSVVTCPIPAAHRVGVQPPRAPFAVPGRSPRYCGGMAETQREPVPRVDSGELDTAVAFLSFARHCVLKKADGLSNEQLRRVLVDSGTSILGLVQHLAEAERYWFGYHLVGAAWDADREYGMAVSADRAAADVLRDYRAAIEESDRAIRAVGDPEVRFAVPVEGNRHTLRWVMAHMTSETARHAGHADILREQLDGTTGR